MSDEEANENNEDVVTPTVTIAEIAKQVLNGDFGYRGAERNEKLKAAGFDPKAVDKEVKKRLNNPGG